MEAANEELREQLEKLRTIEQGAMVEHEESIKFKAKLEESEQQLQDLKGALAEKESDIKSGQTELSQAQESLAESQATIADLQK